MEKHVLWIDEFYSSKSNAGGNSACGVLKVTLQWGKRIYPSVITPKTKKKQHNNRSLPPIQWAFGSWKRIVCVCFFLRLVDRSSSHVKMGWVRIVLKFWFCGAQTHTHMLLMKEWESKQDKEAKKVQKNRGRWNGNEQREIVNTFLFTNRFAVWGARKYICACVFGWCVMYMCVCVCSGFCPQLGKGYNSKWFIFYLHVESYIYIDLEGKSFKGRRVKK